LENLREFADANREIGGPRAGVPASRHAFPWTKASSSYNILMVFTPKNGQEKINMKALLSFIVLAAIGFLALDDHSKRAELEQAQQQSDSQSQQIQSLTVERDQLRKESVATPSPAIPQSVEEWQSKVLKEFPQIGIPGSNLNSLFVQKVRVLKLSNPSFFEDIKWPYVIAEQITTPGIPGLDNALTPEPTAPSPTSTSLIDQSKAQGDIASQTSALKFRLFTLDDAIQNLGAQIAQKESNSRYKIDPTVLLDLDRRIKADQAERVEVQSELDKLQWSK
jgi:hypothetical protein